VKIYRIIDSLGHVWDNRHSWWKSDPRPFTDLTKAKRARTRHANNVPEVEYRIQVAEVEWHDLEE
jgi:hypothetical protein